MSLTRILLDVAPIPDSTPVSENSTLLIIAIAVVLFFMVMGIVVSLVLPMLFKNNYTSHRYDAIIPLGSSISFSGRRHGSVGVDYQVVCDTNSFVVKESSDYTNPNFSVRPMCGGDEEWVKFTLESVRKGIFTIEEVSSFRGNIDKIKKHIIKVQ